MMLDLSGILVCVRCGAVLPPNASWDESGTSCASCGAAVPVVRGIPRFAESDAYARSFSFEWQRHARTQLDSAASSESERTFREKTGFIPAEVAGKLVLDAGCGMGRFADVVSRWGGNVVAFDLSYAVEAAYQNIGLRDNMCILQADLFKMPFRKESFDIIYSIGVLHHTPNCEAAFRQLPGLLKPGGTIAIWVYETMGLGVKFSDCFRMLSVRIPPRLLYAFCHLAAPLGVLYRTPLFGSVLKRLLPISTHPKAEWRILDTFDWYASRYQSKHTYPEVYHWFRSEGLVDIELLDTPVAVRGRRPGP